MIAQKNQNKQYTNIEDSKMTAKPFIAYSILKSIIEC